MDFKEFLSLDNLDSAIEKVSLTQLQEWEQKYPLFKAIPLLILKKQRSATQTLTDEKFEQRAWNISNRTQLADLIFERPEKNVVVKEASAPIVVGSPVAEIVIEELNKLRKEKTELIRPLTPRKTTEAIVESRLQVERDLQIEKGEEVELTEEQMRNKIKRVLQNETQKLSEDAEELKEQISAFQEIELKKQAKFERLSENSAELKNLKSKIKAYSKSLHFEEREKDKQDLTVQARLNPLSTKEENLNQISDFLSEYKKKGHEIGDRQKTIDQMVNNSINSESIPVSEALAEIFAEQTSIIAKNMSGLYTFVTLLIVVVCVLLGLVVLVQNPKGGGLGAGFGGGGGGSMGGHQKTTDFLEKATWSLAIALLALSLISNAFLPKNNNSGTQESELIKSISEDGEDIN